MASSPVQYQPANTLNERDALLSPVLLPGVPLILPHAVTAYAL
jgi:hypothetical protein